MGQTDLLAHALDDRDVDQVDAARDGSRRTFSTATRLSSSKMVIASIDLDAGHVLDQVRQVGLVDRAPERPALAVAAADERMQVAAQAILDLALDAIRLPDGAAHQRHLERDLDVARLDDLEHGADEAPLVEIVLHEAQQLRRRDQALGQSRGSSRRRAAR